MELIDKSKLLEGLKKLKQNLSVSPIVVLKDVESLVESLEVKEVDLEKEIYDYFNEWQNVLCDEDCCNEGGFCCVLDENVKPVNIERCRKVAKHFFKLGINSK